MKTTAIDPRNVTMDACKAVMQQAELPPAPFPAGAPKAVEVRGDGSPAHLLRMAVEGGADVEKLEKLMALQERWQAEQARKAFFAAMNAVQGEIEPIRRDATNKFTQSRYARLESIHKQLCPVYTKAGFSISFGEGTAAREGEIRITATVMHRDGHSQEYHADLAPDTEGAKGNANKTAVQGKGSTFSYGRRYLETMIFNVALTNDDDDGNGGKAAPVVTEEQSRELRELCEAAGRKVETLCDAVGVKTLEAFPVAAHAYWCKRLSAAANGGK